MWTLQTSRGQRLALPRLPAVVGSDRGLVDVVLPHPSIADSHARFATGPEGGLEVASLGEALVEVGGWRVDRAELKDGDELVLGKLGFTVRREAGEAASNEGPGARDRAASSRVAGAGGGASISSTPPSSAGAGVDHPATTGGAAPLRTRAAGTVGRGAAGGPRPGALNRRPGMAGPRRADDEISLRNHAPLKTARPPERRGLLHVDLSQLHGGARWAVIAGVLAVGAALAYGVAWVASL